MAQSYMIDLARGNARNGFDVVINRKRLRLRFKWNRIGEFWSMSIYDVIEEKMLIDNMPMVVTGIGITKRYDLFFSPLMQFNYFGIGAFTLLHKKAGYTKSPERNDLFDDYAIVWWDIDDVV